jgi:helix-turn-helix resolvase-like protein
MTRVYTRKFSWEEAGELHSAGMSMSEIARRLGVSRNAVRNAVNPEAYARERARHAQWVRNGQCPDCGAKASKPVGKGRHGRCKACAYTRLSYVHDGQARCVTCKEWKPLEDFGRRRSGYRGVRNECKACGNAYRRASRARRYNPKQENAHYQVKKAVRDGTLVRPGACSECGDTTRRIEAHHPSYDAPLDVIWLCTPCHSRADRAE